MARRKLFIDSFAGGGGASHGIKQALGFEPDIAINHDKEALEDARGQSSWHEACS